MALEMDIWTADIVSRALGGGPDLANITLRQAIDRYTEIKLAETARQAGFEIDREGDFMAEFQKIPFSSEKTIDKPIRLTADDKARSINFFANVMQTAVGDRDKVLMLMAADRDDDFGKLLGAGMRALGAEVVEFGQPELARKKGFSDEDEDDETHKILRIMRDEGITSVVAEPTHMIKIAREAEKCGLAGLEATDPIYLRSIILAGEFAPDKTVMMLEEAFEGMIFELYGRAETGYGCALSCGYGRGSHVREADYFIELINPLTGEVVRGESERTPGFSNYGEIVVTSLRRDEAPIIRYRTNDFSRWVMSDCPCGSSLKRLDKVVPGEKE